MHAAGSITSAPLAGIDREAADRVREAVLAAVTAAGFRFVALDQAGVQSGAFTLPLVE